MSSPRRDNNDTNGNDTPNSRRSNDLPFGPLSFFWSGHRSSRVYLFSRRATLEDPLFSNNSMNPSSSANTDTSTNRASGTGNVSNTENHVSNNSGNGTSNTANINSNDSPDRFSRFPYLFTFPPMHSSLSSLSDRRARTRRQHNVSPATASPSSTASSNPLSQSQNPPQGQSGQTEQNTTRPREQEGNNDYHDALFSESFLPFSEALIFNHVGGADKSITAKRFKEFEVLESLQALESHDNCCSICYDAFEFPVHLKNNSNEKCNEKDIEENKLKQTGEKENRNSKQKKRSREESNDDVSNDEQDGQNKKKKLNSGAAASNNVSNSEATIGGEGSSSQEASTEPTEPNSNNTNDRPNNSPDAEYDEEKERDILSKSKHTATKLPCGHIFGTNCAFEWLKSTDTCPYCRAKIEDPYRSDKAQFIVKRLQGVSGSQFLRDLLLELARV